MSQFELGSSKNRETIKPTDDANGWKEAYEQIMDNCWKRTKQGKKHLEQQQSNDPMIDPDNDEEKQSIASQTNYDDNHNRNIQQQSPQPTDNDTILHIQSSPSTTPRRRKSNTPPLTNTPTLNMSINQSNLTLISSDCESDHNKNNRKRDRSVLSESNDECNAQLEPSAKRRKLTEASIEMIDNNNNTDDSNDGDNDTDDDEIMQNLDEHCELSYSPIHKVCAAKKYILYSILMFFFLFFII